MRDLLDAMTTVAGVQPATNAPTEPDRIYDGVLSRDDGSTVVFARDEGNGSVSQERAAGKTIMLFAGLLALGGCAVPSGEVVDPQPTISPEVLMQLSALAAPYQDLQSVRLRPEDGCYWYRHIGPVEATMLPLRTPEGRPICAPAMAQAAGS